MMMMMMFSRSLFHFAQWNLPRSRALTFHLFCLFSWLEVNHLIFSHIFPSVFNQTTDEVEIDVYLLYYVHCITAKSYLSFYQSIYLYMFILKHIYVCHTLFWRGVKLVILWFDKTPGYNLALYNIEKLINWPTGQGFNCVSCSHIHLFCCCDLLLACTALSVWPS